VYRESLGGGREIGCQGARELARGGTPSFALLARAARPSTWREEAEDHLPAQAAQRRSHHHRVANMKKRRIRTPSKPKLTQDEADRLARAQADEDSAWQKVIVVRRPKSTSLSIPAELAARAAFLAGLHRESRVDKWVERIVRERVEIEESAFTAAKKALAS